MTVDQYIYAKLMPELQSWFKDLLESVALCVVHFRMTPAGFSKQMEGGNVATHPGRPLHWALAPKYLCSVQLPYPGSENHIDQLEGLTHMDGGAR